MVKPPSADYGAHPHGLHHPADHLPSVIAVIFASLLRIVPSRSAHVVGTQVLQPQLVGLGHFFIVRFKQGYSRDVLERTVAGFEGGAPQGVARALAQSTLVSADMAHAVHPNFADRHEPGHQPVIGSGPVIKQNAGQAYASDAVTAGEFANLCARVGVSPQVFVSRSDLACGSTIGPITAARLGIRTVDVGNPMLSMHSCRELAGAADVGPMIDVLTRFFAAA